MPYLYSSKYARIASMLGCSDAAVCKVMVVYSLLAVLLRVGCKFKDCVQPVLHGCAKSSLVVYMLY